MSADVEHAPLEPGNPPLASRLAKKSLKRMADFLRARRGRPVPEGEAAEALGNLTRFFRWLSAHRKDLKDNGS
jgi:hypothetical protein